MKRIIENIVKVLIILLLIAWIAIIFIDWYRTTQGKNPMFCISEKTTQYADGETYKCVGIGYKMFRYNRTCAAVNFGPFFLKELDVDSDTSIELCKRS